jgi:hypothetical protein
MMLSLQRLWIRLTSNPRQFWMLCATVAIGMLLWARLIVVSSMPRTAIADDPEGAATDGGVGASEGAVTSGNVLRPAQEVRLDTEPERDPFAVNEDFFPKPTQMEVLTAEVDKSDPQGAEDSQQSEARLVVRLQGFVSALELEAAMPDAAMAIISGTMYRSGDEVVVSGVEDVRFRITEIRNRAATLEWQGRFFELKMETPGG